MLEKALSGFDATAKEQKEKPKDKAKPRKSSLVPDPRPAPPPPEPASGIDVVIQFELSDDLCMKRAAGRFCESCFVGYLDSQCFACFMENPYSYIYFKLLCL